MRRTLAVGLLSLLLVVAGAETVYEAIGRDPTLSKFLEMVNRDEVLRKVFHFWTVTVFVPDNEAIEKDHLAVVGREKSVASYHVLNLLAPKHVFPFSSQTFLGEALPVYLNTKETGDPWSGKEYYVNNAKITRSAEYQVEEGKKQLLYVIDEVLIPYEANPPPSPKAQELVERPSVYNIQEHLGGFASRVKAEKMEELFLREGNHTYFVPVGEGVGHSFNRLQKVDEWIIRGHVIPRHVLFTRTAGQENYISEANDGFLKVELSLVNETNASGNGYILYAQSNTVHSNERYKRGVVRSRIVKPNIPVRNGVVHLIESPLMIIDITVWEFVQNEKNGRLSEFLQLINYAPDFQEQLLNKHEKTLLAPSNDAIRSLPKEKMDMLKSNRTALTSLLQLHLMMKSVSTDEVWMRRVREVLASDDRTYLYFHVVGDERNRTLTVDAAGVNSTAIQADVGAVDGMVHIIDRLLGMPYMTVYQKLQTDPELRITYALSCQEGWNEKLRDPEKRFTFFVPSDSAWREVENEMPTEYKQLTLGIFPYHAHKILDRHQIVGEEMRAEELEWNKEIQMIHSTFKVVEVNNKKVLEWEGIRANISRPNLQAINGIIHVIDRVMMKQRDLTKASLATTVSNSYPLLVTVTMLILLAVLGEP